MKSYNPESVKKLLKKEPNKDMLEKAFVALDTLTVEFLFSFSGNLEILESSIKSQEVGLLFYFHPLMAILQGVYKLDFEDSRKILNNIINIHKAGKDRPIEKFH